MVTQAEKEAKARRRRTAIDLIIRKIQYVRWLDPKKKPIEDYIRVIIKGHCRQLNYQGRNKIPLDIDYLERVANEFPGGSIDDFRDFCTKLSTQRNKQGET